jgi:hypothetical protein
LLKLPQAIQLGEHNTVSTVVIERVPAPAIIEKETRPAPVVEKATSVKETIVFSAQDSALYNIELTNSTEPAWIKKEPVGKLQLPLKQSSEKHAFGIQNLVPRERYSNVEDVWVSGVFILIASAAIWLQLFNKKYLELFFRSTTNFQLGNKLFRDHNTLINRISIVLNLIFTLSISFFILMVIERRTNFEIHPSSGISFLVILGLVAGILLTRFIILKLIGGLFHAQSITNEYLFNLLLTYKIVGVVLIPVIVAQYFIQSAYAELFTYAGFGILTIGLIIRVLKGLRIILRSNIFLFYIVLYLCVLEILPLLVVLKSIINVGVLGS